jgi:hypothetical protein
MASKRQKKFVVDSGAFLKCLISRIVVNGVEFSSFYYRADIKFGYETNSEETKNRDLNLNFMFYCCILIKKFYFVLMQITVFSHSLLPFHLLDWKFRKSIVLTAYFQKNKKGVNETTTVLFIFMANVKYLQILFQSSPGRCSHKMEEWLFEISGDLRSDSDWEKNTVFFLRG